MDEPAFQAAILDMDGVVTQTAGLHARAWKQMFDEFLQGRSRRGEDHAPFDIETDYRQYVDGKSRYDGVRSFLESRGIDLPYGNEDDPPEAETICGLGNRKNQIFHELLEESGAEVYEDALEQIASWKQAGMKVGIISASRNCEAILKSAHLLELFDAKVDGNDSVRHHLKGKPAPDIFLHAAQMLGIDPGKTIVVEDALAGVQAAAGNFGLVVGVARAREADKLRQAGADIVVHDLRELRAKGQQENVPRVEAPLQTPASAIDHADRIARRVQQHKVALFLDYDGTLTPIVRRPEEAVLSDETRALLRELSQHCTVAIVSGRDRQNAEAMVQVPTLIYAGSHGFDIRGPGGLQMQQEDAKRALPELDLAEEQLRQLVQEIEGAHVERKKFAIAVHYREVRRESDVRRIEKAVDEVLRERPMLRKRGGKKIFEVQPDVEWDKGRAVLWLAEALDLDRSGVVLIYIGDDVTDEDAFRMLRTRGTGIGIRVASPGSGTHAAYYLRDCDEVQQFLRTLLGMLQHQGTDEP